MSIVSHLTTSSTPKRVNPTSIRCAGKIGPSNVLGVRAITSVLRDSTHHYQPGLKRYRCKERDCKRTFNAFRVPGRAYP